MNGNEWPLPPKLKLVCSMDEHNFLRQIVSNVSISMMTVFQQWNDNGQLFNIQYYLVNLLVSAYINLWAIVEFVDF